MNIRGLWLVFFLAAPAWALDETERLQFADGLYSRGMYSLAAAEYEGLLQAAPTNRAADVAHFRLGECHRHLGNLPAADKEYRQVFTNYPSSPHRLKAGFRRADLFMETKQYGAAEDLFRSVLALKPPEDIASASVYFLGEALLKQGKITEAADAFNRVRETHPASVYCSYALLKLGEIHGGAATTNVAAAVSDPAKALSYFNAAAAKPATDRVAAEALFQMAEIYFRQKEYTKSAEAYKSLLSKHPADTRSAEAALQAAWAAHNAGLYADALSYADAAVTNSKPAAAAAAEWLYLKANCERQLMRQEAAVRTYADLLKAEPSGRFANAGRYEMALSYYQKGLFDEAVREAGKVSLDTPLKKDVYWLLAESFSALKADDQAIQYYRLLIRDFPQSDVTGDAAYRLAHHLQEKGEYQEASRFYNSVVTAAPAGKLAAQSLYASAMCLAKVNRDEEAVRDWSRLVREHSASPFVEDALYQKATAEIRLRRDADALTTLEDLVKRFPKTKVLADAHFWRGVLLQQGQKAQDAEAALRLALASAPRQELGREAQYHLAVLLHQLKRFDEAVSLLQPLVASPVKDKFTPALLRWVSEYSFDKKAYPAAVGAANVLVERKAGRDWEQIGWGLMGRAYLAQSKTSEAEQAFKKCLDTGARTQFAPEAALRLGDIALANTNPVAAQASFEQAATLSGDESLLGVRARAYAGLAKAARATKDLEKAARYDLTVAILYDDPELVPECLFEAAQSFTALGNTEAAAKARRELMERYPQSRWAREAQSQATNQPAPAKPAAPGQP